MVKNGITRNALAYTIGPACISSDEIFQAFEYHERLKVHEAAKKEEKANAKKFEVQEKKEKLCSQKISVLTL